MYDACDLGFEPALQSLDREPLQYATASSEDDGGLNVVDRDFWGQNRQREFFDIRVFNPFECSYSLLPFSRCYRVHEQDSETSSI